jgi:hypothetical protein
MRNSISSLGFRTLLASAALVTLLGPLATHAAAAATPGTAWAPEAADTDSVALPEGENVQSMSHDTNPDN